MIQSSGKDQSLKLEVKERPDVGVFVKVEIVFFKLCPQDFFAFKVFILS